MRRKAAWSQGEEIMRKSNVGEYEGNFPLLEGNSRNLEYELELLDTSMDR